jgi:hypothetical protein
MRKAEEEDLELAEQQEGSKTGESSQKKKREGEKKIFHQVSLGLLWREGQRKRKKWGRSS